MKELNKFIGILRRCDLSKDEIIRTLQAISDRHNSVFIDSWKGKSSFEISEEEDKIIVTKYQKPEKDAEPKKVKTEIEISEIRKLYWLIKKIFYEEKTSKIKSRMVGERYYNKDWDTEIFCKRPIHNKFTIMLNVLEKKNLIKYIGGNIYL